MTVAKVLLLSQYTYVATVLTSLKKRQDYIQTILDNFILYNSFLNYRPKSSYEINQDILHGNKNLGGLNACCLKPSKYTVAKVNIQLDEILSLVLTREDILHWSSAKWQYALSKISEDYPTYQSMHTNFLTKIS